MVDDAAEGPDFPPAPWHLRGGLLVSVLRVPERAVPDLGSAVPPGCRPVRLGSDVVVGLAFAHYGEGSVLSYDELLTAVLLHPGPRPGVTVPRIWVTTAASVAGGRALWAVPKERCGVDRRVSEDVVHAVVTTGGAPIAAVTGRIGRRLVPARLPLPLATVQRRDGDAVVAHSRVSAEARALRVRWQLAPAGPLGHLAGRRPLLSVALTDARLVFGLSVTR